jgi:hypothetical protein
LGPTFFLILNALIAITVCSIIILPLPDKGPEFLLESRTLPLLLACPKSIVNRNLLSTNLIVILIVALANAITILPSCKKTKVPLRCLVKLPLLLACPRPIFNESLLRGPSPWSIFASSWPLTSSTPLLLPFPPSSSPLWSHLRSCVIGLVSHVSRWKMGVAYFSLALMHFRWNRRMLQKAAAGQNAPGSLEPGSLDVAEEDVEHHEVCGELWVGPAYGRHVCGDRAGDEEELEAVTLAASTKVQDQHQVLHATHGDAFATGDCTSNLSVV